MKDGIDQLYDSFPQKGISREEFRRRYVAAMDPGAAKRDLDVLTRKRQIDKAVRA